MRKKGIILLVILSMVFSLAACGKKTVSSDVMPEEIADEAVEGGLSSGDVHLKFWCDTDEVELFTEMIDAFIALHKNEANITVEYEMIGAANCKDVALADIDNCADVFSMPDDQLLTMVAAGVLEPIYNQEDISSRNSEGSVEASSVNGTVYAYPVTADNGYFLYYDKKYFSDSDVETLEQILAICEENDKKFVMDWSSGWYLFSFFGNTGLTLSLNDDGLTNSCDWNSTSGAIKGTDVANALLDISSSPAFWSSGDFPGAAQSGSAIAIVSGVWDINAMKKAFGNNYGACKLPTFTCAGKQIQMSSFTGYRLLGINSYSENRAWAEALADYLTNEDNQNLRFEKAERGPSNINASKSDAILKVPAIKAVQEQGQYGYLQKVGPRYWAPTSNFGNIMAEGNSGNAPVQDLLDTMVSSITE